MLTCIRKLASLCLVLDLSVTIRWIPSEINVSDRPSRIHDPSQIRDKSLTNLLTTVVKKRSHRDEMTAHREPRKTASMIQDQDGSWRATSLESGHKLCTNETEKSETVVARRRSGRNQRDQLTDMATDEKSEDTCSRRDRRRLKRERQRCDVFNRWRCGDKEKATTLGKVTPWTSQGNCESWRGSDPREFVISRQ